MLGRCTVQVKFCLPVQVFVKISHVRHCVHPCTCLVGVPCRRSNCLPVQVFVKISHIRHCVHPCTCLVGVPCRSNCLPVQVFVKISHVRHCVHPCTCLVGVPCRRSNCLPVQVFVKISHVRHCVHPCTCLPGDVWGGGEGGGESVWFGCFVLCCVLSIEWCCVVIRCGGVGCRAVLALAFF